jgi:hypothetical protein
MVETLSVQDNNFFHRKRANSFSFTSSMSEDEYLESGRSESFIFNQEFKGASSDERKAQFKAIVNKYSNLEWS